MDWFVCVCLCFNVCEALLFEHLSKCPSHSPSLHLSSHCSVLYLQMIKARSPFRFTNPSSGGFGVKQPNASNISKILSLLYVIKQDPILFYIHHRKHNKNTQKLLQTYIFTLTNTEQHDLPWKAITKYDESSPFSPVLTICISTEPETAVYKCL